MSNNDIIRAWKDEDYRNSLSDKQGSQLPENPAGIIELPNEVTQALAGGGITEVVHYKRHVTILTRGIICDML